MQLKFKLCAMGTMIWPKSMQFALINSINKSSAVNSLAIFYQFIQNSPSFSLCDKDDQWATITPTGEQMSHISCVTIYNNWTMPMWVLHTGPNRCGLSAR